MLHKTHLDRWLEKRISLIQLIVGLVFLVVVGVWLWQGMSVWTTRDVVLGVLTLIYILISIQAGMFLYWTLYAWNDPEAVEKNKSPKVLLAPAFSFTALLAARNEEKVIGDTIRAIANMDYPEELKELVVITHGDDPGTIMAALKAIDKYPGKNIKFVVNHDQSVMNKPRQLNFGLAEATGDVVVPFDAEDQPHKDLYKIINTVMLKQKADVVQSGVQLINFRSNWFSALNCLEYYFWFKSALHWFAKAGIAPLGGNTVFFKRLWLSAVGGWDDQCLTEDADIGIRLTQLGAKVAVVYDEIHATQEETPTSVNAFIKQRTRWHLGYLQILAKGDWKNYRNFKQRFLALYVLILPELVAAFVISTPILAVMAWRYQVPIGITMLSYIPTAILIVQFVVLCVGMWQFTRDYKKHYPLLISLQMLLAFGPYTAMLVVGSIRATIRFIAKNVAWEKTAHVNAHRLAVS